MSDLAELEQRAAAAIERLGLDDGMYAECVDLFGFDSPATRGCLLALVREARGDSELTTQRVPGGWALFGRWPCPAGGCADGKTEVDLLLNALEAT